jgi:hypothetical protein
VHTHEHVRRVAVRLLCGFALRAKSNRRTVGDSSLAGDRAHTANSPICEELVSDECFARPAVAEPRCLRRRTARIRRPPERGAAPPGRLHGPEPLSDLGSSESRKQPSEMLFLPTNGDGCKSTTSQGERFSSGTLPTRSCWMICPSADAWVTARTAAPQQPEDIRAAERAGR